MVEVYGLTGYKNSKKVLNVQGKSVKIFTSKCKNRPIYHFLLKIYHFPRHWTLNVEQSLSRIANPTEQRAESKSLLTPLSRICNPTAPSISICNALINTIWVRKHIYALKMLILITVGLQIQPSRTPPWNYLQNGCTCFVKYMHLFCQMGAPVFPNTCTCFHISLMFNL